MTAINTLKTENTADHAAIRKEATDALAAHAAANDKAFADEASARKAVSDALTAHETADAADHAAIRKTLSDSLASAKQEQHDTLGISGIVAFDGFVGDVSNDTSETAAPIVRDPRGKVQQGAATVHFSTADGNFLIKQDVYYPIWEDDYLWQDSNQVPWRDKSYYNVNDGKLYKIGSDNQLHEIALTKLRDDTGILPCKVRTAAPLAEPTTGYPTAHNYTIWWSQTTKAFFAALGYEAAQGDVIEGCEYYPLSVCDEYYDYCSVTVSGSTQTAVPRADRIYRSGNDLWQYDSAAGEMVKLGDVTGKDLAIQYLECGDATLQGDVEVTGYLEVDNGLTVQNGLMVENSDITVAGGDIHVQGEAELGSVKTTGDITANGKVSGIVVHGDSATFCQGEEVKIDVDGNISTEGSLTVSKGIEADSIVSRGGLTVGTSLTAASGEISGDLLVGTLSVDSDITAENITANGNINAGFLTVKHTATLSDTTIRGDITFDGGSVSVDSGSLAVASGAGFYADNINAVRIDGRIDFVFHGIRQSLPTDYTAVAQSVSPKTRVDGSTYDIIYIRDKKRFVAVDDAAKTYAERFYDEEEYNIITNNKPTTARTDRAWRWGADIYKYDTEAYISAYYAKGNDKYGADLVCVTDAGKALFIKMWRDAIYRPMFGVVGWYGDCDDLGNCYGGKNNPQFGLDYGGYYPEWHETPGFFLNGITGISYAEARQIYEVRTCGSYPRKISEGGGIRTNMLCNYAYATGGGQNGQGINTPFVFQSYDVQVIRVAAGLRGQRPTGTAAVYGLSIFYNSDNVEEVIGAVWPGSLGDAAFNNIFPPFGSKLQYLWIDGLSVSLTKTFAKASSINVDCLRYLVEKSRATAAKPISVTLHADVFAVLPEDILTLAETKYVTFVSA
ncbi:unknown [Prevotella sp. CAG:873]|nr:unknown [Prevotella sp. CAG:873]